MVLRYTTNSVRGAGNLVSDALACARRTGAAGLVIVRADSAYYCYDIVAAARRAGARFSVAARHIPELGAVPPSDRRGLADQQYANLRDGP
jgi:hypothetical protein